MLTITQHRLIIPAASFIGGGQNNTISGFDPDHNVIFGGANNHISFIDEDDDNPAIESPERSVIGGGQNNRIQSVFVDDTKGGGDTIEWHSDNSAILGGQGNVIIGEAFHAIGGGQGNKIYGGRHVLIGGGQDNHTTLPPSNHPVGSPRLKANQPFRNRRRKEQSDREVKMPLSVAERIIKRAQLCHPENSTVIGGGQNNVSYEFAFVGGGSNNHASSVYSVIPGGDNNTVTGQYSLAAGRHMNVIGSNTFVWGFHPDTNITISQDNAFVIYNSNGVRVGIGTHIPEEALHIVTDIQENNTPNIGLKIDGQVILGPLQNNNGGNTYLRWNEDDTNRDIGILFKCVQDLAETFETSEEVEAGDLLVIDATQKAKFKKSTTPYDRKVVGIASSTPAIVFEGSQIVVSPDPEAFTKGNQPPVALKGRVLVKVSLENGAILPGDVLTSSSTPGHAMKSTDSSKENGAIIGKALTAFSGGSKGEKTGHVLVFVALH